MNTSSTFERGGVVRALLRAAAGSAGLRIVGMGFGFLAGIQLARQLGVEGYGIYGVAMSIVALMSVLAEFGLPQLITREVSVAHAHNDYQRISELLRWATNSISLIFGASALIISMVLFAVQVGYGPQKALALLCSLPLIWIVSIGRVRGAALRGMQQIISGQIPETLVRPAVFSLALLGWSFFSDLKPYQAILLGVASAVASLAWVSYLLHKSFPKIQNTGYKHLDPAWLWKSAFPMAMTEGMRMLQAHLSMLILGAIAFDASVGLYRAATSLGMIMALPLTLFSIIGSPMIARLHVKKDYLELQKLLSWMSLGMTVLCGVLALPFLLWGQKLIGLILGSEFSAANNALLIICLGSVLTGILGQNAVLLNMTGHQDRVMRASMAALIIILFSAPAFAFAFHDVGAAMATTLALFVWNVLLWRDGVKLLGCDASIFSFFRRTRVQN